MKKTLHFSYLVALFCAFSAMNPITSYAQITPTAGIVYVTPDGSGNGSDWDHATADLQGAINAAGVTKVFVAAGNYPVGDHSFIMKNGVEIYGGFHPVNNTTDWNTRTLPNRRAGDGAVLDGQNTRPVIWNDGNQLDNTAVLDGFTLMNGSNPDGGGGGIHNVGSSPVLRNLAIKNNSASQGGGIYNQSSSPAITNCIFTGNSVTRFGGGMQNVDASSPTLINCFFTGNSASIQGGAVYNLSGHGTFTNVTLVNNGGNGFIDFAGTYWQNSIIWDVVWWGNVHIASYSLVQGATSIDNDNLSAAGVSATDIFYDPDNGDYTLKPASLVINKGNNSLNTTATDLEGNARIYNNGTIDFGAYEYREISPDANSILHVAPNGTGNGRGWKYPLANLQAAINTTGVQKVYVATGNYDVPTPNSFVMKNGVEIYGGFNPVNNTTDWDTRTLPNKGMGDGSLLNGKNERPVVFNVDNGLNNTAVLDGFTLMNGRSSTSGGGIFNRNSAPVFNNLVIRNNRAETSGGGIYNVNAPIVLSNTVIKDNTAQYGGGMRNNGSASVITNVAITGNSATLAEAGAGGGGIFNENSALTLTNVQITGNNTSFRGGGFRNLSGNPILVNVTLADNNAVNHTETAGIDIAGGTPQLNNSILYGTISGTYDSQYSLIEGSDDTGDGNIDATDITSDDVFNGPGTGDYNLKSGSPAVDAGDNSRYPHLDAGSRDIAGNPRLSGTSIDLGAYELPVVPGTMYVREGANGDGSDWDNATGDLQGAINAANVSKILVAVGSYKAPAGSFVMKKGVAVYGGFDPDAGITDLSHDRIMPDATFYFNASVLDGSNERPVIYNHFAPDDPLDDTAILDGFAIVGGTGSNGGGIHNYYASPTLKNLLLMGNTSYNGAGMYNYASSPALVNVDITDNTSDHCAGIFNDAHDAQSLTLINVAITGNNIGTESSVGGIHLETGVLTATNTTIANNSGARALRLGSAATALVNNSIIYGGIVGDGTSTSRNSIIEGRSSTNNGNLDASGVMLKDLFVNKFSAMLSACSPAINAGDNSLLPAGITTDITGADRIQLGTVDMGAYEAESNTPDETAAMATRYQSITLPLDLDEPTVFTNDCSTLVATINSSGESPVTGETTARVWIEEEQPKRYVRRHYEIFPETGDPDVLSGEVTIYFTQEEFDDYNKENSIKLPIGPDDEDGIENIIIEKRGGKSTDGTGRPHTYPGDAQNIYPRNWNIWWSQARARWEVTFYTEGFSGFFLKTNEKELPVRWISFEGRLSDRRQAVLTWKTVETNVSHYEVERSNNAKDFRITGTVMSDGTGSGSYSLTDPTPVSGTAYFRIRQVDLDGTFSYSRMIALTQKERGELFAYPNPVRDRVRVELDPEYIGSVVKLVSTTGIVVEQVTVKEKVLTLDLSRYASGVYLLQMQNGKIFKVVKE